MYYINMHTSMLTTSTHKKSVIKWGQAHNIQEHLHHQHPHAYTCAALACTGPAAVNTAPLGADSTAASRSFLRHKGKVEARCAACPLP